MAYIPACTQITEHNHSQTGGAVYCNVPEYQCTRKLSMLNCSPTHPHLMRQKGLLPSFCWAAGPTRRGRWEGRAGKKWFCGTGRAWQEQGKASQERNDWHSWGRGIDAPWLTHSFKHHQLVRRQTEKGIPRGFLMKYFTLAAQNHSCLILWGSFSLH